MGIRKITDGHWRITCRVRVNGQIVHRQRTIEGNKEQAKCLLETIKNEVRQSQDVECSLKQLSISTFGDIARYYIERKGYGGMESYHRILIRDLGEVPLNQIGVQFDAYLQYLKSSPTAQTGRKRKANTLNHYIEAAKIICSFAYKNEMLSKNPMDRFEKWPEEGRDRVLSEEEKNRLLDVLKSHDSYLYWPVRFAIKNPIRPSDMLNLRKDNYDMVNNWVHFYAAKTRKRRNRETCLVCIDDDLRDFFNSLPNNSYLFPHDESGEKIGSFRSHWEAMLREAGIDDFVPHDMKHCACTFMRDAGFTELDFENLGISYTKRMMQLYYKHDAQKALVRWKTIKMREGVNTPVNTLSQKTV